MAVYFVVIPKNVRYHDAKAEIKACDPECRYTSATRKSPRCFFVKTEKSLDALLQKTYENDAKFVVEPAKALNEQQFDDKVNRRHTRRNNKQQKVATDKPAQKEEKKEAPKAQQQKTFRAFVLARENVTFEDIAKYFKNELQQNIKNIEQKEGKNFGYLCFESLEDCRKARQAFKDKPMENVVVRPYMSYRTRMNFRKQHQQKQTEEKKQE